MDIDGDNNKETNHSLKPNNKCKNVVVAGTLPDTKDTPWVEKYRSQSIADVAAYRDIIDTRISDVKTRKGLALVDIAREVTIYRLSFGCNNKLQLDSLIATFTWARAALVAAAK